jgi:RNA-binding protein
LREVSESLRRLGKVLHLSSGHSLILRSEQAIEPRIGENVVDEQLKPVGFVYDVFGPTSSPYIAVKPSVKDPSRYVNAILYSTPVKRR